MQTVDKGLILRETPYKEADVMLSVLTECGGKLSVLARGAKRKGSRISAGIQLLTYSEFTLYESGGRYTLNEAEPIEMFYGIRNDIVKLALASYFAEVLEQAADEETINPELLRLGLNSLYALSKTSLPHEQIKAVFELKVSELSGYAPNVGACSCCGSVDEIVAFDVKNGCFLCSACNRGGNKRIDGAVADAMRFVLREDVKRIFSFNIGEESMKLMSELCEEYLRTHFERNFKTNTFYKSLL